MNAQRDQVEDERAGKVKPPKLDEVAENTPDQADVTAANDELFETTGTPQPTSDADKNVIAPDGTPEPVTKNVPLY